MPEYRAYGAFSWRQAQILSLSPILVRRFHHFLDHCRTDLLKILKRQHDLMPHKEEAGMADPDMLKIKSISCVIKGYAHKRVSKDGLPDTTAVM